MLAEKPHYDQGHRLERSLALSRPPPIETNFAKSRNLSAGGAPAG